MKKIFLVFMMAMLLVGCGTQETSKVSGANKVEEKSDEAKEGVLYNVKAYEKDSQDMLTVHNEDDKEVWVNIAYDCSEKGAPDNCYQAPKLCELYASEGNWADFVNGKTDTVKINYEYKGEITFYTVITRKDDGYEVRTKRMDDNANEESYISDCKEISKVVKDGYTIYYLTTSECTIDKIKFDSNMSSIKPEYITLFSVK